MRPIHLLILLPLASASVLGHLRHKAENDAAEKIPQDAHVKFIRGVQEVKFPSNSLRFVLPFFCLLCRRTVTKNE